MKKLSLTLLGTTVLVGGLAAAALANDGRMRGHPGHALQLFEQVDANGDGTIERSEVEAFRAARFAEADADGDGKVTPEELQAMRTAWVEKRTAERFASLDADGDGSISEQEFMTAQSERRQAWMGGEHGEKRAARHFDRMDANNDGALDAEELGKRGMRLFERLDGDDDGVVTREEAQQAMAEHRDYHHHRKGRN